MLNHDDVHAYSDDVYCDVYDDDVLTICSMTAHFKTRVHTNCWALNVTFSVGWFFACYRFHCFNFLLFLLVIGFIILIFCPFFS